MGGVVCAKVIHNQGDAAGSTSKLLSVVEASGDALHELNENGAQTAPEVTAALDALCAVSASVEAITADLSAKTLAAVNACKAAS